MNERVDLSIIIVSWNTKKYLKNCLESIYQQKGNVPFETFVVDNNSSDGSQDMVKKDFPNVHLTINNNNAGFAKANNQALKNAKGRYFLLLNSDTKIKTNTLSQALKFASSHPKAGVIGGKIMNPDGSLQKSVRHFPTLCSQILILLKLHNFFPHLKSIKKYFALDFDYNKEQEVDQVMGAFFMINNECLKQVGFFDEKFWIWFEEVDFCKRVKEKGWLVIYTPVMEIIHAKGQSFAKFKAIKEQIIFNRSLLYYFKKQVSYLAYLILLIFYPFSIILALIVEILEKTTLNLKLKHHP